MIERDVVERRQPRVARVVIGFVGKVRQQRYRYQRPARIAVVENEDRALARDILPMAEAADELRRRDAIGSAQRAHGFDRSEEHTSELQSLMRISYAVFCLKKKKD